MGRNCLEEVLRYRPESLQHVFLAEARGGGDSRRGALEGELRKQRIPFSEIARHELDEMVSSDSHQGVVAQIIPRTFLSIDDLCEMALTEQRVRFLALDGVVDPQNFGAVLRAAECFGIDAVLWSKNRGAPLGPVVSKASVGASELVGLCPVSNLHQALESLRKAGVWSVGAVAADDAEKLERFEFPDRCVVVMGSEGEGIQPLIEKNLDFRICIAMYGRVSSLNVSQATTVMLHQLAAQHRKLGDVKVV
jgi:23S rRNA (guanosine2251-2'-O)-methyltransferase